MAGSKEIRTKIKSVQNTRKITKAMEMVAASKMRKAQDRMRATRPYGDKIRNIAAHLAYANPEYKHPFLVKRATESGGNVGLLVVTTDKGLCGGLNTNALRVAFNKIKEWQAAGKQINVSPIGNKGFGFMQRLGAKIASHVTGLGDTPHLDKLIGPVKVQLDLYSKGEIDALYIVYTRFINTMKQEPAIEQLLPLPADRLTPDAHATKGTWDYIYEPDPKEVLEQLLVRYIEQIVYQSVAENMASEQSARMVAMKAASDNAKTVIDELTLIYNKTRQAAITKELSEIVGGAAAV
jgi:F-type H+-transporting ATPase subunit gamma